MLSRIMPVCRKPVALASVLLLFGCDSVRSLGLLPLKSPPPAAAAPPRMNGTIDADYVQQPIYEQRAAAPGVGRRPVPARTVGQHGEVALNFADTDIREVVRVILGDTLRLTYTIDPNVRGSATLQTGAPLPTAALLPTLETLLNQNGATLVRKDGIYRVMPVGATALGNPIGPGNATETGTQVVPLRYVSARDLAKVLEAYASESSKVSAHPARNALIVSGDRTARHAMIALIRALDTDALAGRSFAILPTEDGEAPRVAGTLEKALLAENGGAANGLVQIVPLPQSNAVLVASSQPRYLEAAKRLYRLTNTAQEATGRSWHVYYVRNGQSADLENLLQRAFTPRNVSGSPAPGSTAPGAEPALISTGFGTNGRATQGGLGNTPAGSGAPTGGGGAAAVPASTGSAASAQPSAAPLSADTISGSGASESRVRIIANRASNALLIYATAGEFAMIEGMLRKTDIMPLQVLIEATIAEVTLNDQIAYGTQFYLGNKLAGMLTTAGPASATGSILGGTNPTIVNVGGVPVGLGANFPGFVLANGVREVLNALASVTEVKVLSSPHLMVLDNEPARLQVGQQVPILTGTATSTLTTGAPVVNSIDYHSTGVIMQVTPHINSRGLVTLDVAQEVSDVAAPAPNTASGSPTFDDRIVRTRVAVQDGQTVALAGLIRDNAQEGNSGIPVLKDIPLLGTLFSSQNSARGRTELLVLITPHVAKDPRDARVLTDDLRNEVFNAAVVPQDLPRKPVRGRANPNGF